MKMNIFFSLSGLFFCLVHFSIAQNDSAGTITISVASWCSVYGQRVDLQDVNRAILLYERYFLLDCEILLANRAWQYVVISFYEWDLTEDDELVLRDNYTELSLTGKTQWYGDKTFIFRGPTTINFTTKHTFSGTLNKKFKLLFTVSNGDFPCEKSDFKCNNKICLNSRYVVCDGYNNCGDWSDEIDCDRTCLDAEFHCSNNKCIPINKLCNGNNDCGDMTDEYLCNRTCESYKPYKCNNGICISNDLVCNNRNDCGDWSEERNCHRQCHTYEFPCSNGRCVEFSTVCDGHDDCGDKSDEKKCWVCSSIEHKCPNGLCIPNNFVCNNHSDCGDFSDENSCRVCSSFEHKCPNGLCIPKNFVCNNHNDCGDFSDENGCSSTENRIPVRQTRSLNLPIILSSVAIGSVLILMIILSICFCVSVGNRSKKSSKTSSSSDQQTTPSSLIGRIRQSFRSHRQPSAPPMEMTTPGESAPHEWQRTPSLMGRIRQSFRNQTTSKPPNASSSSDVRSGDPVRSAIYPNLPTGVDNPVFHAGV